MERVEGVRWPRLVGSIAVCLGAGGIGSIFTNDGVKNWYPGLRKSSINPPSGVFAPVWTTLYCLMGLAEYLVSRRADAGDLPEELTRRAEALFALQLGLNVGWSFLFFKLRSPFTALIEIVVLWIAIVLTIRAFARVSRPAALLLVPYLAWTTFATALNASIWWLNRGESPAKRT